MTQQLLSTVGKVVLERNPFRRSFLVHNPNSITSWLLRSDANGIKTGNAEIRLPEGAAILVEWLNQGSDAVVDRWSAIAESGTPTIIITEFVGRHNMTTELERQLGIGVRA